MAIYEIKLKRQDKELVQEPLNKDAIRQIRRRITDLDPEDRCFEANLKKLSDLEKEFSSVPLEDVPKLTPFQKLLRARGIAREEHAKHGHGAGEGRHAASKVAPTAPQTEPEPLIVLSRRAEDQMLWSVVDEDDEPVTFVVTVYPYRKDFKKASPPEDPKQAIRPQDFNETPLAGFEPIQDQRGRGFSAPSSGGYLLSGVPLETAEGHHYVFQVKDKTGATNDPDWYVTK